MTRNKSYGLIVWLQGTKLVGFPLWVYLTGAPAQFYRRQLSRSNLRRNVRYNTPLVHGIIRARSPSKVASWESSRARCATHTHVNESERGSRLHYRVACALAARTCRLWIFAKVNSTVDDLGDDYVPQAKLICVRDFLLNLWNNCKLRREASGDWALDNICDERSIDTSC